MNNTPLRISFLDLSERLDSELRLIADLTQATEHKELIFNDSLKTIGEKIIDYLEKRNILEHVYLKRSLRIHLMEQTTTTAEIWRIKKIKNNHVNKSD